MNIMKSIRHICILALLLSLAGCATTHPVDTNASTKTLSSTGPAQPGQADSASVQLAEAASSVSNSMLSLEEIQQAATPAKQPLKPPAPSSYGMGEVVSVNWTGPVGPLVQKIAQLSNYNLRVMGTPPQIPIVVTINAKNVAIGKILQNAGYQCGKRANIIVYPSTKVIELRYAAS